MSLSKPASPASPTKTEWWPEEVAAWSKMRDFALFRKVLVAFYCRHAGAKYVLRSYRKGLDVTLSCAASCRDVWNKVDQEFRDGPQLLLDLKKVKQWFHNNKAMQADSPLAKVKAEMEAEKFDINKAVGELQTAYHQKPLSVSYRETKATSAEFQTPPPRAPRTARMNAAPAAGAGAGSSSPESVQTPTRAFSRDIVAAAESDGDASPPPLARAPTIVSSKFSTIETSLAEVCAALLQQNITLSQSAKLISERLGQLGNATWALGRAADTSFVAQHIAQKKAESKAAEKKERDAVIKAPDGPDGTDDIKGDTALANRSQQNVEAAKVLAQRQNSDDAKDKTKRKIESAALAANPDGRDAKRQKAAQSQSGGRGRGKAAKAAAAAAAAAAEAEAAGDAADEDGDAE